MNRLRLIVCLEENIFIHNIKDLNLVHSIKHVSSNPNGIIALAPSNERCYLAYPARNTIGEVNIFDADKLEDKLTIAAHDNPLVSLTFDSQGIKLATASEKVDLFAFKIYLMSFFCLLVNLGNCNSSFFDFDRRMYL